MGESKLEASKVVALIGLLVVLREAIVYFYSSANPLYILWGILALIIAVYLFISLKLINFKKVPMPYNWWILLIFGIILVVIAYFTGFYLGCTLILIAFLLEFLSKKKTYAASKIVLLIGAVIAIIECVLIFMSGFALPIVSAVFGLIFAIILILTIWGKINIKIPFAWWVVLIVGFVIFTYISTWSGTVIFVGFILLLMAY